MKIESNESKVKVNHKLAKPNQTKIIIVKNNITKHQWKVADVNVIKTNVS